jgi:Tfp pilus assembly protein PilO
MKTILSIILILASVGGFIAYIVPTYTEAKSISQKKDEYLELLSSARTLAEKRDKLLQVYNGINPNDIARLEKMLPSNPDNVKLILEIDALAKSQGLALQNVKIKDDSQDKTKQKGANPDIGSLTLELTTVGPYPGYVTFISALEKNLRIINVKKVSFLAPDDKANFQYQTTVETYWVK